MSAKALVFLVIVLATCLLGAQAGVELEVSVFDSYVQLVNHLPTLTSKVRVLQAVSAQFKANHIQDLNKLLALYNLVTKLIDETAAVSAEIVDYFVSLQQEIAQYVLQHTNEHVPKLFSTPQFPKGSDLSYLERLASLDPALKRKIFKSAIVQVYELDDVEMVAAIIHYLRKYLSLEDVLRLHLYLYREFANSGDDSDVYLFNVAYYMSDIRKSKDFDKLSARSKRDLNKVIASLPNTLQYLFDKPYFCLLNKFYEEYYYTTDEKAIDDDRMHTFTYAKKKYKVREHSQWVVNATELAAAGPVQGLQLQFLLRSNTLNTYTYRESVENHKKNYENIMVTWNHPAVVPPDSDFVVEYFDDVLAFKQNGHIMCAIDQLYGSKRRFVYAYQDDEHNSDILACQWIAQECP